MLYNLRLECKNGIVYKIKRYFILWMLDIYNKKIDKLNLTINNSIYSCVYNLKFIKLFKKIINLNESYLIESYSSEYFLCIFVVITFWN